MRNQLRKNTFKTMFRPNNQFRGLVLSSTFIVPLSSGWSETPLVNNFSIVKSVGAQWSAVSVVPVEDNLLLANEDTDDLLDEELEGEVEQDIEDSIEQDLEQAIDENVQDDIEESIQQDIEQEIEDEVQRDIEVDVEQDIEDSIEEDVEASVNEDIEQDIEEEVQDEIEDSVEQQVEDSIEQDVEDNIEKQIEQEIEDDVQDEIEDGVEKDIEDSIEQDVEEAVEDDLDDDLERDIEQDVEDEVELEVDDDLIKEADEQNEDLIDDDTGQEIDEPQRQRNDDRNQTRLEQQLENSIEEINGERIFSRDWLVLASPGALADLTRQGYDVVDENALPSLGFTFARVIAPASYNPTQDSGELLAALSTSELSVDFNHIYAIANAGASGTPPPGQSKRRTIEPASALPLPTTRPGRALGIVDSSVKTDHSLLRHADIRQKFFLTANQRQDWAHGTAVASILVGKGDNYKGLLPNATVYSASVFFVHPQEGPITTAAHLMRALDWLISQRVTIINMSLTGPHNRLLSRVIQQICAEGFIVVAAVGNSGPNSPAQFPAAYPCAVGVTAIDSRHRVYRRAVRGDHVDIAAYGVNLLHAGNTDIVSSSGTSFATPFVSAYIAAYAPGNDKVEEKWLNSVFSASFDLGAPGHDEIYGHGLLPAVPVR